MQFSTNREIKNKVRKIYAGKWIDAIKLNIIPILLNISSFLIVGISSIFAIITFRYNQISNQVSGSYNINDGLQTSSNFLFNALLMFIIVSIQYGTLDWLRKNKIPNMKTSVQTFSRKYFTSTLAIFIFQFIFNTLWYLVLIVPGIVKYYSYSQAYMIYKDAENRGISQKFEFVNFITFSRRLMDGNKLRLFVLQISMLGWLILSILSLGIGFIWYIPYKNGVYTEFYNDLVSKNGKDVLPEIFA